VRYGTTLQPVVVGLAGFDAAGPREVHGVELLTGELLGLLFGEFLRDSADEDAQNCFEQFALTVRHRRGRNALGR
jgi:hypothetical protein